MRLHRLTGLEQEKIHEEYKELLDAIADYLDILGSEARLLEVIRAELLEIKEQYGDARRTEITDAALRHRARGPDRAGGHGGDAVARGLRQDACR